jgi:hypothetical protein
LTLRALATPGQRVRGRHIKRVARAAVLMRMHLQIEMYWLAWLVLVKQRKSSQGKSSHVDENSQGSSILNDETVV